MKKNLQNWKIEKENQKQREKQILHNSLPPTIRLDRRHLCQQHENGKQFQLRVQLFSNNLPELQVQNYERLNRG